MEAVHRIETHVVGRAAQMLRLIVPVLLLVGVSGCTYENPYDEEDARAAVEAEEAKAPDVTLEVTYLSSSVAEDGLAHVPQSEFKVGQPIYLTVVLKGQGTAKVEGRLQASEQQTQVLALVERNIPVEARGAFTLPSGFEPAPGSYYISVVVDGVPSWGLPFTVAL